MSRPDPVHAVVPAVLAALLALPVPGGAQDDPEPQIEEGAVDVPRGDLLVRDLDRVWTATGEQLEDVSILVRDGKIRAIGPDLEAPDDVEVVDGDGRTAIPGIVDAHTHTAMRATNEATAPVTPEVRVRDALDPGAFSIYQALAGGVTSGLVLHGSANPIGGESAVIKMRWQMDRADQLLFQGAPRTVKFALGENVTQKNFSLPGPDRFPKSRVGVEQVYEQAFDAAREYRDAWEAYREDPDARRVPPRRDHRLETLVDIMEGRIDVHAHSYRADEIVMLMDVAERYGFDIDVFQHVLEGYKVASEMAEHGAAGSTFSDWWMYKLEAYDAIPYNAAIMHRHGVSTSINSDIPWLQSFMVYEMSKPVKYGDVPKEEALRMLTLYPAEQLRIDDRVGTLEEGKDGDIVLLSGDPFDTSTRVEKTVVDGMVEFDAERDEETRGEPVRDLPPLEPGSVADDPVTLDGWPDAGARANLFPTVDPGRAPSPRDAPSAGSAEAAGADSAPGRDFVLSGGTVHPVSGPPVEDGVVVVRDGRIAAVGPRDRVETPDGVPVRDVSGQHVYPGLIDPNTQLGLVEIGAVGASRDDQTVGKYNAHFRTVAGINPLSAAIPVARANGVTAALTSPATGVVRGAGSLIQLRGDTPRKAALLDRAAIMVDFPSPEGNAWDDPKLDGRELEDLAALFRRAQLYGESPTVREDPTAPFWPNVDPEDDVLLASLAPAVRGEVPVLFEVSDERGLRTLLLFLEEFPEVDAAVVGGDQAYRVADELAERGVPVIVGSEHQPTMDRDDPVTAGWENAARLHRAGVKVAFTTGSVSDVRRLPEHAARAWAYGLPRRVALQGMTLAPAEILGLGDELGSIEEGKRADLLVTDGDPLQITTTVRRAWIGGEEVGLESRHTRLRDEYRGRE
jgi:imidazolonepropionase-like amidohydrolase